MIEQPKIHVRLFFLFHTKSTIVNYNESMKKILVVEDEPDIRELLGNYLRNESQK
jgi:hypothetical protein